MIGTVGTTPCMSDITNFTTCDIPGMGINYDKEKKTHECQMERWLCE